MATHRTMDEGKEDINWGNYGSLTRLWAKDKEKLINAMRKDGWDPNARLEAQREWWEKQKKDKGKRAAPLLIHQLVKLIERHTDLKENREKQEQLEKQQQEVVETLRGSLKEKEIALGDRDFEITQLKVKLAEKKAKINQLKQRTEETPLDETIQYPCVLGTNPPPRTKKRKLK